MGSDPKKKGIFAMNIQLPTLSPYLKPGFSTLKLLSRVLHPIKTKKDRDMAELAKRYLNG
jgi:hypothetical protein